MEAILKNKMADTSYLKNLQSATTERWSTGQYGTVCLQVIRKQISPYNWRTAWNDAPEQFKAWTNASDIKRPKVPHAASLLPSQDMAVCKHSPARNPHPYLTWSWLVRGWRQAAAHPHDQGSHSQSHPRDHRLPVLQHRLQHGEVQMLQSGTLLHTPLPQESWTWCLSKQCITVYIWAMLWTDTMPVIGI